MRQEAVARWEARPPKAILGVGGAVSPTPRLAPETAILGNR